MRWKSGRRSRNVEDLRGRRSAGRGLPGGMRLPIGGKKGGSLTTVLIVFAVLYFLNDGNLMMDNSQVSHSSSDQVRMPSDETLNNASQSNRASATDELADFVSVVLADTEDTWTDVFRSLNKEYIKPKLVLFSQQVRSACGTAHASSGPFYCPGDQKLYIDLSFYEQLKRRHNAPGDFAQAYVIAHEVGHHVQTLLGISGKVQSFQRRASKTQANQMLVRLELQADCLAGLWANHAQRKRQILEEGDIEEALNAASQIGDDVLQRQSQGYVVPASFTHGTSEQRMRWFKIGIGKGDLALCDTFNTQRL